MKLKSNLNEKRNIVISIMIAGALAGMGAGLYYVQEGKFVILSYCNKKIV